MNSYIFRNLKKKNVRIIDTFNNDIQESGKYIQKMKKLQNGIEI